MELLQVIGVTDSALYENGIPHKLFEELRRTQPVSWSKQVPGVAGFQDEGFWVVSTHALVQEVSRDAETYSSWENTATARYEDNVPRPYIDADRTILLNKDAPEHTAPRRIISRDFTPRVIGRLRAALTERTSKIVSLALETEVGDFVKQVEAELPLQDISDLVDMGTVPSIPRRRSST